MLRQFPRWLYRGHRPNTLARWINRGTAAVFARGVAPDYFVMLEVVGRRSGRPISFPLVMAVVDAERYLVSRRAARYLGGLFRERTNRPAGAAVSWPLRRRLRRHLSPAPPSRRPR